MKHFIFAIDTSYSMYSIIDKIIDVVNKFLNKLKTDAIKKSINDIYVSILSFNNNLTYQIKLRNIKNFQNIYGSQFQIWGTTALYDCIYEVINNYGIDVEAEHHFYIITDGQDNISKHTKEVTNELIENAINIGKWDIVIYNTENIINLNIPVYMYSVDTISDMFGNLTLQG